MGFADWKLDEVETVHRGLLLLGWRADIRSTSDEAAMLSDIASKALEYAAAGQLTPDLIDDLSAKTFEIIASQVMVFDERASMVSGSYKESEFFRYLIPLIDEAALCYYRGYFTSALATLFIVLESYLRKLKGWLPGMPDMSFLDLRTAVKNHPDSEMRDEAEKIISVIYARYNASSPPQFLFNRHGLLHGLRGPQDVDRMNCVKMFLLFDVLCWAEGLERAIVIDEEFSLRCTAYEKASQSRIETTLLSSS